MTKGKAIYRPAGKAGEYAEFACNFYNGCSNNCDYCYCKLGVRSHVWSDKPTLKKQLINEDHALAVFIKEMNANLPELQKHGLFFTFTSDPMLPETIELTWAAVIQAITHEIPVKILTKRADFIDSDVLGLKYLEKKNLVAFGFTLTGHDELEPGASTNAERIEAMKKLHAAGFKTFASIEPIVDFESSARMIGASMDFCDLYKIGLMSGRKYGGFEARLFIERVIKWCIKDRPQVRFYFKDSLLTLAEMERMGLPHNCVGRDFNLFKP